MVGPSSFRETYAEFIPRTSIRFINLPDVGVATRTESSVPENWKVVYTCVAVEMDYARDGWVIVWKPGPVEPLVPPPPPGQGDMLANRKRTLDL